jgi:hypothetical protein
MYRMILSSVSLEKANINQIYLCKFEKPAVGIHPPVGGRIASNAK